jgi:hypothetical protein
LEYLNLHYNATMLRRLILIVSLITAFGLGQQGAAVHAISHLADAQGESQQHKHAPLSHACEKCVVYAQLGSAVGVEYALLVLADQQQQITIEYGVHRASHHSSQYAARAPPQLT